MIVTLDGPAGAGKSTVARLLAERLDFRFLDTGAMYRAVAWAGSKHAIDWNMPEALVALTARLTIAFEGERVIVDRQDVTAEIRTPEITSLTRYAADNLGVRAILVKQQRLLGAEGNIVTEGRDQGTVVFPHAECKIYLTASPEERARRRKLELAQKGEEMPYDRLLAEQNQRDERDRARAVGALAQAADAILISTDGLDRDQVVDRLEAEVRRKIAAGLATKPRLEAARS